MGGYQLTAIIEREDNLFVARCVELDIAGQREESGHPRDTVGGTT